MDIDIAQERYRCASSFAYFCKQVKVRKAGSDELIHPWNLNYQSRLVGEMRDNKYVVAKLIYDEETTNLLVAWMLWKAMHRVQGNYIYLSDSDLSWEAAAKLRQMLREMPEWLKPEIDATYDERHFKLTATNSTLQFRSYKFELEQEHFDGIYIENAAFIPDMPAVWENVQKALRVAGRAVVASIPNGTSGVGEWFYKTYSDSTLAHFFLPKDNTIRFARFSSNFMEHPVFREKEWRDNQREKIGTQEFRQRYIGAFETGHHSGWHEESPTLMVSSQEEEEEFMKRWHPEWSNDFPKDWEAEKPDVMKSDGTLEHVDPTRPSFLRMDEGPMPYLYSEETEKLTDKQFLNRAKECVKQWETPLNRDVMYLAGLYSKKEYDEYVEPVLDPLDGVAPDQILGKVSESGFPQEMKFSFRDNYLYINELSTKITEQSVKWMYMGHASITSHEEAVAYTAELLAQRLKHVF